MGKGIPEGLTIVRARELILGGELSPVELAAHAIERIESLNPKTNAFISVMADQAMEAARLAQEALARGKPGALCGIPISLKDLFDTRGVATTGGSRILRSRIPERDATVVRKLKDAGAVLVGKTNLHEFAYGVTSENPHYGPVRNPWNLDRMAGGSSGGSAVSVACGMALGSLGSDTGGSIRIPAALTGTVGLKPSYGRVSGAGVIPLAWSFDTFGPMTRTVADAALLLGVIAGVDPEDPRTRLASEPFVSGSLSGGISGVRFGVPSTAFDRIEVGVASLVEAAIARLETLGGTRVGIELPGQGRHEPVFRSMAGFEVLVFHEEYLARYSDLYGSATRARIERGRAVRPADYLEAQRERMRLQGDLAECFERVDLIVLPAVPVPAPRVGEDPLVIDPQHGIEEPTLSVLTRHNRLFSITGTPSISVPCGFTSDGLPAGLQIAGRMFDEERVMRVAWAYEQDAAWDLRPPL